MRIGRLEKAILTVLLTHGAKTSYELIRQIESGKSRHTWTRQKAFLRTIKQLRKKNLIIPKPYFKYTAYFCRAFANIFWAEGTYWRRYNGSGFLREKTRCFHYGYYHIFGLTHQGKILARRKEGTGLSFERAQASPYEPIETHNLIFLATKSITIGTF